MSNSINTTFQNTERNKTKKNKDASVDSSQSFSSLNHYLYLCKSEEFVFMHAKSLQSCSTLCDPMDFSLPGSSVHGIPQARILKWVAMPSSRVSSGYPGSMQ